MRQYQGQEVTVALVVCRKPCQRQFFVRSDITEEC